MWHSFDIELAKEYGVGEAILIANFSYWIAHNRAHGKNFHAGAYWMYNSVEKLTRIFPYFSAKQIRRITDNLVERGVMKKASFNKEKFDRTSWYAFINEDRFIGHVGEESEKDRSFPNGQHEPSIIKNTSAQKESTFAHPGEALPYNKQQFLNNQIINKELPKENFGSPEIISTMVLGAEGEFPPIAATPQEMGTPPGLLFEPPPIATPPPKKKAKTMQTLNQKMIKIYFDFHEKEAGIAPMFGAAEGVAMKAISEHLVKAAAKETASILEKEKRVIEQEEFEEGVLAMWQMIFDRWTDIEPFYQQQLKLTQIRANLTNIFNQLKNGKRKQGNGAQNNRSSGLTGVYEEILRRRGNG